ncbi:MAG: hypothetical protein ACFFBQ_10700 [Promethearchaeota archaeon]
MKKTPITLVKMGGSLITYKKDSYRIKQYLDQIDFFKSGTGSLGTLTEKIIDLVNFYYIN